jgi:hypothetical protein
MSIRDGTPVLSLSCSARDVDNIVCICMFIRGRRIKRTVAAIRRVKRRQVGMNNDISSGGVATGARAHPTSF